MRRQRRTRRLSRPRWFHPCLSCRALTKGPSFPSFSLRRFWWLRLRPSSTRSSPSRRCRHRWHPGRGPGDSGRRTGPRGRTGRAWAPGGAARPRPGSPRLPAGNPPVARACRGDELLCARRRARRREPRASSRRSRRALRREPGRPWCRASRRRPSPSRPRRARRRERRAGC